MKLSFFNNLNLFIFKTFYYLLLASGIPSIYDFCIVV
jgi:hypothetical protein